MKADELDDDGSGAALLDSEGTPIPSMKLIKQFKWDAKFCVCIDLKLKRNNIEYVAEVSPFSFIRLPLVVAVATVDTRKTAYDAKHHREQTLCGVLRCKLFYEQCQQ